MMRVQHSSFLLLLFPALSFAIVQAKPAVRAQAAPARAVQAQTQPAQTQPAPSSMPVPVQTEGGTAALDAVLTTEIIQGLRDPFQIPTIMEKKKEAPKADLELVQLKDIKLNGVVTGPKKTRALLSVPNGKTFFVSTGDHVGIRNGHISKIRPGAITVIEYDTDENGKQVPEEFEIQMNGEVVSLSNGEG